MRERRIGIRELEANLNTLLHEVRSGTTLVLTDRPLCPAGSSCFYQRRVARPRIRFSVSSAPSGFSKFGVCRRSASTPSSTSSVVSCIK